MVATQQRERGKDPGPDLSLDRRPVPKGAVPLSSQQGRQSVNGRVPDLRTNCPVCGNPYQAGEAVLELACRSVGANPVPPVTEARGASGIVLGHRGCVLPRLLTLLAAFQPEARFLRAAEEFSAAGSVFPEGHDEQP
jgi:hypothetical protein